MPAPRRGGCQTHHFVWWGGDGRLIVGCAHCPAIKNRIDVSATYDHDTLVKQIRFSRDGHSSQCGRPIYSA